MKILIIEDEKSLADLVASRLKKEEDLYNALLDIMLPSIKRLVLDKTSTIKLTGDTYSTNSNINLNGYKLYVGGKEYKK